MTYQEEAQTIAFGKTKTVIVPSGRQFVLRETNGEDDDILSNSETGRDQSNVDYYLARVVIKEITDNKEIPFSFDKARKLLKNDRTALLLHIRIHNLGAIVKFSFDFGMDPKTGGEFNYVEDISQYIHDYTKDFPLQGEEGYFKYKIPPYPEDAYSLFELSLQSGKRVRMGLMNGEGQSYIMNQEFVSKNTDFKARNLEIDIEGKWVKVENFAMFSSRDMVELRAWEKEIDPKYLPITEIEHPHTKQLIEFNMLNSPDFFYPVEI